MRQLMISAFLAMSLACALLSGCGRPPEKPPEAPAPEVIVCAPLVRKITDYNDFEGRTKAVHTVEVRARVSGYLQKVLFKEGMEVKAGETLFIIDPTTYQADYDRALANVNLAKAHLERVQADFKRAEELLPRKAISQSDFDLAKGDRDEGAASVKVAEAALETAGKYLDWTKVRADDSGRISRQMIDPGNMVKADDTLLTTIVSQDPIYAYFDVDERTSLEFRRMMESGKVQSARDVPVPIWLGLADEEQGIYPHEGTIELRRQRAGSDDRHAAIARQVPESEGVSRPGHVGPRSRAGRFAPPSDSDSRRGPGVRPGQAIPLCGRQGQQGRVSAGDGWGASRWAAGDR